MTTTDIVVQDVLHKIAIASTPEDSFPDLLDAIKTVTDAKGACLLLYEEPRKLELININEDAVLPDSTFQAISGTLTDTVSINPPIPDGAKVDYAGMIIIQLNDHEQNIGVVWLVFDDTPVLSDQIKDILNILLDSLMIVVKAARANARHEKLSRNQSEFMRIVSHDLRSPLTSVKGFASMLQEGKDDTIGELNDKQAYFVEKILSGIVQLSSLVDNFQDAGRFDPETGFYEMQRSQCDLGDMAHSIVRHYLVPAEKQELAISAVIDDNVPIINVDVNMIERAIINLVDNAIKYTPNGCEVEIGVHRKGESVILSVKDNGLGISPENQALLFERHVRIPRREHKRVKGNGLGLFIVRSVARRHGGDAWVESAENEGSTFYINIPLNEENAIVS